MRDWDEEERNRDNGYGQQGGGGSGAMYLILLLAFFAGPLAIAVGALAGQQGLKELGYAASACMSAIMGISLLITVYGNRLVGFGEWVGDRIEPLREWVLERRTTSWEGLERAWRRQKDDDVARNSSWGTGETRMRRGL